MHMYLIKTSTSLFFPKNYQLIGIMLQKFKILNSNLVLQMTFLSFQGVYICILNLFISLVFMNTIAAN